MAHRVVTNAHLMAHITSFQHGFPLIVRALATPPLDCLPRPTTSFRLFLNDDNGDDDKEQRSGVFASRAIASDNLPLLATMLHVVARHPEYQRVVEMSVNRVITTAIAHGNVEILTWLHTEIDEQVFAEYGRWATQQLAGISRRISEGTLAWLCAHRPECFQEVDDHGLELVIRRGHEDLLRCYHTYRPDKFGPGMFFQPNDLVRKAVRAGQLHIVRFLHEQVGMGLEFAWAQPSTVAVEMARLRRFYFLDYLRERMGDEREWNQLLQVCAQEAVESGWADVIDYVVANTTAVTEPIVVAASQMGRVGVLERIAQQAEADPTLVTSLRRVALRHAAKNDHVQFVQCLVNTLGGLDSDLANAKLLCESDPMMGSKPISRALRELLNLVFEPITAPKTVLFLAHALLHELCRMDGRPLPPTDASEELMAHNTLTWAVAEQDTDLLLHLHTLGVSGFDVSLVEQAVALGLTDLVAFLVVRLGLPRPLSSPEEVAASEDDEKDMKRSIEHLYRQRHWPWKFSLYMAWTDVAEAGTVEMLEWLDANGNGCRPTGMNVTISAAFNGNLATLEWLLDHQIDDLMPFLRRSTLMEVLIRGHLDVFKFLFVRWRDVVDTPLTNRAMISAEMLTFLSDHGVPFVAATDYSTVVQHTDDPSVITFIYDQQATSPDPEFASRIQQMLLSACVNGRIQLVRALIDRGVDQLDSNYDYLAAAARIGHVNVVRLLYETRASRSPCDVVAVIKECMLEPIAYKVVKFLVETEASTRNVEGLWTLVDAIVTLNPTSWRSRAATPAVTFLLSSIQTETRTGSSRDRVGCVMPDSVEDESDAEAAKALQFAVERGRTDVLQFVHRAGGKGLSSSLVDTAVACGQSEIVRLLTESRGLCSRN